MKVAAIGDNCIDLYEKLNKYYATGNAVDFAVNMKKLGIDTAVISVTGDDEYGKLMIQELEKQQIDLSHFRVEKGKTAVSYMDLDGLERIYLDYVEGVMENVKFTQEDIDFAASCDLVHSAFWGNAHMHLKEIHDKGARICFDFATEYQDPMVEEIAAYLERICASLDILNARMERLESRDEDAQEIVRSLREKQLTQEEAAKILGKCSASVLKMRKAGKLKGYLVGGRYKYRLDDVLRAKNKAI